MKRPRTFWAPCLLVFFTLLDRGVSGQTAPAKQVENRQHNAQAMAYFQPGKTSFSDTAPDTITTVVADSNCMGCSWGVGGDGGPARDAHLSGPRGLFVDASGNLFIAEGMGHRIRKVDGVTGIITTVAGNPDCYKGRCDGFFAGDGGLASAAQLNNPTSAVADGEGNLYICDSNNNRIRRIDHITGIITTIVGSVRGFSGDGGPARNAELNSPLGLAIDASGNLFIADSGNSRVRRVDALNGIITTIAGSGRGSAAKDGQPATNAGLFQPSALSIEPSGDLLVASVNGIHRMNLATGLIVSVAGDGGRGIGGDGGPAVEAQLSVPQGIVADTFGNVFIADTGNHRIRRVDHKTGIVTTIAGTGELGFGGGFSGDGGPATKAKLSMPMGLAVDAAGNLFIADHNSHRIRRVQVASVPNQNVAKRK